MAAYMFGERVIQVSTVRNKELETCSCFVEQIKLVLRFLRVAYNFRCLFHQFPHVVVLQEYIGIVWIFVLYIRFEINLSNPLYKFRLELH